MSAQEATTHDDLEVIEVPAADGRPMESDVHCGRPMRPEYAERGLLLTLAWELGWVSF